MPVTQLPRVPSHLSPIRLLAIGLLCSGLVSAAYAQTDPKPQPHDGVTRGLLFLQREVGQWKTKNKCFSCHNNGDAAQALLIAGRTTGRTTGTSSRKPDGKPGAEVVDSANALKETLQWLSIPGGWHANRGDPRFSDQQLAAIQFGSALVRAHGPGRPQRQAALRTAAGLVAKFQRADGSWQTIAKGSLGSPITYGTTLATVRSVEILEAGGRPEDKPRIRKAEQWLRQTEPRSVLDAAATILGLAQHNDPASTTRMTQCIDLISRGQDTDGGWGPFVDSQSEPFDTALVILALEAYHRLHLARSEQQEPDARVRRWIREGRRSLLRAQEGDGSWPATTRPPNNISYAHRISTSGWALQALLVSRP